MKTDALNKLRTSIEDLLKDRKAVIRIMTILLIIAAAGVIRIAGSGTSSVTVEAAEPAEIAGDSGESAGIYVDIGGAVNNPGVYKADTNTRLYEIIDMAGGLRSDADTDAINQAAFVEDGAKIIIPIHNISSEDGQNLQADQSSSAAPGTYQNDTGLININTADKSELMTLNGIGDVMADRIIEYRSSNRFRSIEDIKSVKGIGDSIFNKIRDSITV